MKHSSYLFGWPWCMHNIRLGHFQARSAAMRLSKTNYACRLPILSLSPFPKIRYKNLKFASDLYGLSTVTTIKITCALIAQLMVKSIILNNWLKKTGSFKLLHHCTLSHTTTVTFIKWLQFRRCTSLKRGWRRHNFLWFSINIDDDH